MDTYCSEQTRVRLQIERQLEAETALRKEAEEKELLAHNELLRLKRESNDVIDNERQKQEQMRIQIQTMQQEIEKFVSGVPNVQGIIRIKQGEIESERRAKIKADECVALLQQQLEETRANLTKDVQVLQQRLEVVKREEQKIHNENIQLRKKLREDIYQNNSSNANNNNSNHHINITSSPTTNFSPSILWGEVQQ